MEAFGVLQFWTFLAGVVVIILMPGPNSLFVLKTSIQYGPKQGWSALSAVIIGDGLLMLMTYLGLASLLASLPELFRALRYAGALYLLWIGVQILLSLRTPPTAEVGETSEPSTPQHLSPSTAFYKAFFLSLTNPKALLFLLSFFIQFIDGNFQPTWLPYLVLALVLELVSFLYLTLLIYTGLKLSTWVNVKPKLAWFGNLLLGMLFTAFAIRLAWL